MPAGCAEASAVEQQQIEEAKRRSPWPWLFLIGGGGYYFYRRHKKKAGGK